MLKKYSFKKKNLIFLILRIHVLIFSLIAVLWVRSQFKKKESLSSPPKTQSLERKAKFLTPESPKKSKKRGQ